MSENNISEETKRKNENDDFDDRLFNGIRVAQKRMLIEKALHGQSVIIGDGNGNPIEVKAADILAEHKEFYDSLTL